MKNHRDTTSENEMRGSKMHGSTTYTYRQLERIVKGFANHRRLEIINLLAKEPELSVNDIAERVHGGYENISDHLRKLAIAGLVMKRNEGLRVCHKLTPRGESILVFCKKLQ